MKTENYTSKKAGLITISTESNNVTIYTPRLTLHSLNQYDRQTLIDNFTPLLSHPDNVVLFGEGQPWTEQQVSDFIDSEVSKINQGDLFCTLPVHDRSTNQFMGSLHIHHALEDYKTIGMGHDNVAEIGYILASEFWGMGYGTEVAIAGKKCIKHIISLPESTDVERDINEIVATVHPLNLGSKNILEKTLKHHEPEEIVKFSGQPRLLFFKSLRPKIILPPPLLEDYDRLLQINF